MSIIDRIKFMFKYRLLPTNSNMKFIEIFLSLPKVHTLMIAKEAGREFDSVAQSRSDLINP